jgi:hypothetical protein
VAAAMTHPAHMWWRVPRAPAKDSLFRTGDGLNVVISNCVINSSGSKP